MKIGWQRILSMAFLVIAVVLFVAMHFLPLWNLDYSGWKLWIYIGQMIRNPMALGEWRTAVLWSSFLTFSLLIVVSVQRQL